MGRGVFGNPAKTLETTTNRELRLELCQAFEGVLINTCFDREPQELVTYRNFGVAANAPVSYSDFAQLDHIVCPNNWIEVVEDVRSDRNMALQSQHFPLIMEMNLAIPMKNRQDHKKAPDFSYLLSPGYFNIFRDRFMSDLPEHCVGELDVLAGNTVSSIHQAAEELPRKAVEASRPWISSTTLQLIERRNSVRIEGNHQAEVDLNRSVKASAKKDRRLWLEEALRGGAWRDVRKLSKPPKHKQGRLRDLDGKLVDSSGRAETLAEYLEQVQWKEVAETSMLDSMEVCGDELEVNTGAFTGHELRIALGKFSRGKSPGSDGVPIEIWQALVKSPDSMRKLLDLCNECWNAKSIPKSWAHASIVTLFKKGDTSLPTILQYPCSTLVI